MHVATCIYIYTYTKTSTLLSSCYLAPSLWSLQLPMNHGA